ncbi:hypothetical protein FHG67_04210 [Leptospira weilii]|nr:hypothetical protein FHG67_04210 [Leptospira weilii]
MIEILRSLSIDRKMCSLSLFLQRSSHCKSTRIQKNISISLRRTRFRLRTEDVFDGTNLLYSKV